VCSSPPPSAAAFERVVYRPLAKNAGATALLGRVRRRARPRHRRENLVRLFLGSNTQAYFDRRRRRTSSGTRSSSTSTWAGGERIVIGCCSRDAALQRARPADQGNPGQPDLAKTIGINADLTYVICFVLGTICAGVSGSGTASSTPSIRGWVSRR